jgi:hypothetical protein
MNGLQLKFYLIDLPYIIFEKKIRTNPPVPLIKIKERFLIIGDNQEDEFSCEIDYIKLYRLEVE